MNQNIDKPTVSRLRLLEASIYIALIAYLSVACVSLVGATTPGLPAINIDTTSVEFSSTDNRTLYSQAVRSFVSGKLDSAIADLSIVISTDSNSVEAYMLRGTCYLIQLKNVSLAILDYQSALTIRPMLSDAHLNMGAALIGDLRYSEAKGYLDRALELDSGKIEAYFNLGQIPIRYNMRHISLRDLSELMVDVDSLSIWTDFLLGQMHISRGEDEYSDFYFDRVSTNEPDDFVSRFLLGLFYVRIWNHERAETQFHILINEEMDEGAVQLSLARSLFHRNQYKSAKAIVDELIGQDSLVAQASLLKGDIFAASRELEWALRNYRIASNADPKLRMAHLKAGTVFQTMGEYDSAIIEYDKCYDLDTTRVDGLFFRTVCKLSIADTTGSLDDCMAILERDPNNLMMLWLAGKIEFTFGNYGKAVKLLSLSIEIDSSLFMDYFVLGVAEYKLDRVGAAIDRFSYVIEKRENNWRLARYFRGLCYLKLEQFDFAISDLETARGKLFSSPQLPILVMLIPQMPTEETRERWKDQYEFDLYKLYKKLGYAQLRTKKYRDAELSLSEASKELSDDPEIWFWLGQVYQQWSKENKARKAYKRALKESSPGSYYSVQAQLALDSL